MRVIATLTIDGAKETRIEGESPFMSGERGDKLEQRGLGVWVCNWRYDWPEGKGTYHKSRVFIPWSSCLYMETKEGNAVRCKRPKKR